MIKIIRGLVKSIYQFAVQLLRMLQTILSPSAACNIQNFYMACIGSRSRFMFDYDEKLYCVKDNSAKIYFGELMRGIKFYEKGIEKRGNSIFNSYSLDNIEFARDDIVVDCGANYADLFIELSKYIREDNYIAFEPGPVEYACITKNVPLARKYQYGLSNNAGKVKFYLCSKTGDSSVVEPVTYTDTVEIEVITLDQFMVDADIKTCKLLKLEAEGWEPEIIDGAASFLKICEYVAVDGGPERGIDREATLPYLNNVLCASGFRMIAINGKEYRALYERIKSE